MKKLLCFTLSALLAAALAVPAFADSTTPPANKTLNSTTNSDTTEVKFSVQPTYTVTIPATVELAKVTAQDGTVTYENDLTVTASNVRLNDGEYLRISMDTDFQLSQTSAAPIATYDVTVGNTTVFANQAFANYQNDTADQTTTLHFSAKNQKFAGDYSDTVTFNISVGQRQ